MYISLIFLAPLYLLALFSQFNVKSTFNKYLQVKSYRGMSGGEVARSILDRNGLYNVRVQLTGGHLSDHYDPRRNTVNLSSEVYHGTSVAAISVAAHEVGHAIQHAENYLPIKWRTAILPFANFGSQIIGLLLIAAIVFRSGLLINVGILFYIAIILFHVFTLPLEFNASHRAITQLSEGYYIDEVEKAGAKKVLGAAAMTYVAATAVAVGELVRLLLMRSMMGDDD